MRPAYIGLPCRREPGVPPSTSRSTIELARDVRCEGIHGSWTIWTLCDPLPFRPITSPQSSRRSNARAATTNISAGVGLAVRRTGGNVWPMKCVEYGIPEAYGHVPSIT